ncbi:MAG: 50S ribosomal protein L29 [Candidatus Daviesbacteria bacterium]
MKRNNLAEIKKMDIKTLGEKVRDTRKELANLVLDKSVSKLTHPKVIKNKRKDMAQILTVLRQKLTIKELEEEANAK